MTVSQRQTHYFRHREAVWPKRSTVQTTWLFCAAFTSLCLALTTPAHAAMEWVSIKTLPGFGDAQAQLQALVDRNGRQTINRLCVIGQKHGAHFQAEVYWPTEHKLILWVPNINDPAMLVHSRRYLDLKREVRTDVGSSTYLLSRSFVSETIRACSTKGDQFVIQRVSGTGPNNGDFSGSCWVASRILLSDWAGAARHAPGRLRREAKRLV